MKHYLASQNTSTTRAAAAAALCRDCTELLF